MGNLFRKSRSTMSNNRFKESNTNHDYSTSYGDQTNQSLKIHQDSVLSVAVAGQDHCLTGGNEKVLSLIDIQKSVVAHRWNGHDRDITKVTHGRQRHIYFSASRDKKINAWKCNQSSPVQTFVGHELVVTGLTLNPDNSLLCTGSRDNSIRLWDVNSGECLRQHLLAQNLITNVHWGQSVNIIAQSSEDKQLRLWDPNNLQIAATFPCKQYIQTHCELSLDGRYCVTSSNGFGGNGCEATLWDVRMVRQVHEFRGHQETVGCCCFIPTSFTNNSRNLIATCSNDSTVRIWDRDTAGCAAVFECHGSGPLTSIAAFEDGRLCVSSFKRGVQVLLLHVSGGSISIEKQTEF